MSAMETMLASMIGLKPQEMKDMAERIQNGFIEMAAVMKRTEDNSIAILALLEEQQNKDKKEPRHAGRKQLGNNGNGGDSIPGSE